MTVRDVEAGSLELAAGAEPGGGKARLHSTGGPQGAYLVITREAARRPAASSKGGVATRRHSKTRAALTRC